MITIKKVDWIDGNINNRNSVLLQYNNWDDYGYKTTMNFAYCNNDGQIVFTNAIQIYSTQMDDENANYTINDLIHGEITQLGTEFCSLGTELAYYVELKKALPNDYKNILIRLNDLAYSNELWNRFESYPGVQRSLLRSSSSLKALNEAYELLEGKANEEKDLSFEYRTNLPYCHDKEVCIFFDFKKNSLLPFRINAIVGKNGTGKTQLLTKLANDISGFSDNYEELGSTFGDKGRPSFDKIISISFSAFDEFKKLKGSSSLNSYVYCGIQSEKGTLSLNEIQTQFKSSLEEVRSKGRFDIWKKVIGEIFLDENYDILEQIEVYNFGIIRWSSGQHTLICSITEVLSKIDNESIILFDEPEIHLHPNAIANIMRMLNRILNEFDSYAIIATHSPIILQEIPSKNVIVIERIDNQPFIRNTELETFGENITKITRDVFDVSSRESCYQAIFNTLKNSGLTREEIFELFDNNLGLNASIYVEGMYK